MTRILGFPAPASGDPAGGNEQLVEGRIGPAHQGTGTRSGRRSSAARRREERASATQHHRPACASDSSRPILSQRSRLEAAYPFAPCHTIKIPRPRLEDTGSLGNFAKEPLNF